MDISQNKCDDQNKCEIECECEDEDGGHEKHLTTTYAVYDKDLDPKMTSTIYQEEIDLDDEEHMDINVLFKIRNNIEDQINVRTNDVNFKTLIENTIPEISLKPEVNTIIADYHKLFTTEKLENEIKILEKYLNKLNNVIHGLCEHEYHEDYIDLTPDDCIKIIYCSKCKITDLSDRVIMPKKEDCC